MNPSTTGNDGSSMKAAVLLFFLIMSTAVPATSPAATISFGPYFYYAAWEPFYKDNLLSKNNSQSYTWKHRFTMDPAPLYGFSLGFSFAERWSASAVFVTGRYVSRFSYLAASYLAPLFVTLMGGSGFVTPTEISSRQGTNKYDLDTTLSCAVTSFMKVFIGFKYQRYTISEGPYNVPMRLIGPDAGSYWIYNNTRIIYNGYSGGIGVSFSAHVVENLFFFFNVSGLYQYPQMNSNNSFFIAFFGDGGGGFILPLNFKDALSNQRKTRLVYNAVGGNVTTSFAYQIPAAHLTLSLGARYQYLYFMGSDAGGFRFNGKSDHYYGGTFSAIFSFDLNKEAKPSDGKDPYHTSLNY
ncbi:MAG TPA: hypothetical protein PKX40_17975 [Spirochaetota bacterium]|nr:hypothetical protein [Spirochaetota bacterium]